MILRIYLFSLYAIIFLSAGLCALIIFNVNPYESPFWMLIIFYLTLFLFLTGLFSLIGFYLKIWLANREIIFAHLLPTLRQSILISIAISGLIFFQQLKVLSWWLAGLYILALAMIELFFKSSKLSKRRQR